MSNYITKVATLRDSIATLHAERVALIRQRHSRAEVLDAFERFFDTAEAKARDVARLDAGRLMTGIAGASALLALQGHHGQRGYDAGTLQDVFAVVCAAVGRKALRGLYTPAINALPIGLNVQEKAARLDAISAELDLLERQEEALVIEAAAAGFEIQRRRDARPDIILSLHSDAEALE